MNIDIRKYIISNFRDSNNKEIKTTIDSSLDEKSDLTLPGLGVFLEIIWQNSTDEEKTNLVDKIKKGL